MEVSQFSLIIKLLKEADKRNEEVSYAINESTYRQNKSYLFDIFFNLSRKFYRVHECNYNFRTEELEKLLNSYAAKFNLSEEYDRLSLIISLILIKMNNLIINNNHISFSRCKSKNYKLEIRAQSVPKKINFNFCLEFVIGNKLYEMFFLDFYDNFRSIIIFKDNKEILNKTISESSFNVNKELNRLDSIFNFLKKEININKIIKEN